MYTKSKNNKDTKKKKKTIARTKQIENNEKLQVKSP